MNHPRVWIKMGDKRLSVNQAALRSGISPCCLWDRLRRGVPKEELLKPGTGPRLKIVRAEPSPKPSSPRQNFLDAMDGKLSANEYLLAETSEETGSTTKGRRSC
jgi:hypothetical protein